MKLLLIIMSLTSIVFASSPESSELLVGVSRVILRDTTLVVPNITVKMAPSSDVNVNINVSIAGNSKFQYVKAGADVFFNEFKTINSKRGVYWNFGLAAGKVVTLQNTNGVGVSAGNLVRFSKKSNAVWINTIGYDFLYEYSQKDDIPFKAIGQVIGISSGIRVNF